MFIQFIKNQIDVSNFQFSESIDYQFCEKNSIAVFIYGYPFYTKTQQWITAQNIVEQYQQKGFHFLESTEGVFTITILDRDSKKCHVITDRYGIYRLFYSYNDQSLSISDTIIDLIPNHSTIKLNIQSIIEYLHFGFKVGDKTHIQGIRQFENAIILTIQNNLEIKSRIYWRYIRKNIKTKISTQQLAEKFNQHIETAMHLEPRVSMGLTSGLDTRTIFSAALPDKNKLHCYTHGVKGSSDVETAKQICKHFRVPHIHYELNSAWIKSLPNLLESHATMFNGLIPTLNYLHVIESYIKEKGKGQLFFSGSFGNEVWRCWLGRRAGRSLASMLKIKPGMNIDNVCSIIVQRCANENSKMMDIYSGKTHEQIINMLKGSVRNELNNAEQHLDSIQLAEYFVFRNICGNIGSSQMQTTGKYFKIISALLHKDILPQIPLMSIIKKTSGELQKHIIKDNSKYLASLPLSSGQYLGGGIKQKIFSYKTSLLKYLRIALNILSRKLIKTDVIKPNYFQDYRNWLRDYHTDFLKKTLNYEKMITKSLFDPNRLRVEINRYMNGDNALGGFIICLISLEIWLKKVCDLKNASIEGLCQIRKKHPSQTLESEVMHA